MYVHQVMEVVPDGIVTIEAVAGGSVYVTNEEAREVRLKIEREGTCESVVLEASATIRL
jgi:hypothetical protein